MTHAGVSLAGLAFFKPILAFLILFVVVYALLKKTEILGESVFIHLLSSFIIATIFVTASEAKNLVLTVIPGFAVLILAMFFILMFVGFLGKSEEFVGKGMGWFFIMALLLIFIIAGAKIFGNNLSSYFPGPHYGSGVNYNTLYFLDTLYSPNVLGTILFIMITGIVVLVLVKSK